MAKKNKLPVVSNVSTSNANPIAVKRNSDDEVRERRYRAENALSDIERAKKHESDKGLMKDVKKLAKEKVKALKEI